MTRSINRDTFILKESPISFFPRLTVQIEQKTLLYFSNAFTLFEGIYLRKKVFIIELNYLTEETLNKFNNVNQFRENTLKYIPDDKNLTRIGYFYNRNESLFSIVYDKGNMTPLLLQKDSSILQRYQYFYSLLTIVSSFHNKGYSLGLIHPGLIFVDDTIKLNTIDNIFYSLMPLMDSKENIQLMSYFGYFQPNLYDQILSSSQSNHSPESLFLKTDIIMLCVLFKYLFSNKSYDTILCETEIYMNKKNAIFNSETGATTFLNNIINSNYNKIGTIKQMLEGFTKIFADETHTTDNNLSAFACIKCGIKLNTYSTFHKCVENKGKMKKEIKEKEQLDSLAEQIENMPQLKTVSLYDQFCQQESMLYKEIDLLHGDISILIANEEKKFNIIMNYVQNMLNNIEQEKQKALSEKIKQFEAIMKRLTMEFIVKIKEVKTNSLMIYKMGKKAESIDLESIRLTYYTKTLDDQKKEMKEIEREYEDFVKNSQKILGHANYEAKLEDLMNKSKEEYLIFINLTIEYLYEFQEKIKENNDLLNKGLNKYDKMKAKLENFEKQKTQEVKEQQEEEKEGEDLKTLTRNKLK